jgi:hypothetical protein
MILAMFDIQAGVVIHVLFICDFAYSRSKMELFEKPILQF